MRGVYKEFFVHEKSAKYHKYDQKSALHFVERCRIVLEQNEEAIVQEITTRKLPKNVNGPEGNIASKTVESVQLVAWGLSPLIDITELYGYDRCNVQSCLTLDVEHFHAVFTFLYITNFSVNEHQYFGYDVLR